MAKSYAYRHTNNVNRLGMEDIGQCRSSIPLVPAEPELMSAQPKTPAVLKVIRSWVFALSPDRMTLSFADPFFGNQNNVVFNAAHVQQCQHRVRRLSRQEIHKILMENHRLAMARRLSDLQRDFRDVYEGLMED